MATVTTNLTWLTASSFRDVGRVVSYPHEANAVAARALALIGAPAIATINAAIVFPPGHSGG